VGRTRNGVRIAVLPEIERQLGVSLGPRLARLAHQLRVESDLASRWVDARLRDAAFARQLKIEALVEAGAAAGRLVHAWLSKLGVAASQVHLAAILPVAHGTRPRARVDLPRARRGV